MSILALRISKAELNSLLYTEPVGGYDAGFTNDPAMDEYLYEQESLDFLDIDLQDRPIDEFINDLAERADDLKLQGAIDIEHFDNFEVHAF